jgi:hypothetical protein
VLRIINVGAITGKVIWDPPDTGIDPSIFKDLIIPHIGMPKLKPGDTISCMVKDSAIVSPYVSYDETCSFVIVALDDEGYYLFVPCYYNLKNSVVADQSKCRKYQIDKKYLNENIVYISEKMIASVVKRDEGLNCKICNEFTRFAEANQKDGSFICYGCRLNPYR